MWEQLRGFNQSSAGRVPGYCLRNVRLGFGIGSKYPTAIAAWWATQSHKDRNIPSGVDVLLFYTYKLAGHVNVRLKNGKVWSDGVTYASLEDYERQHPAVHYLGWGESLNGVPVIQYVSDPVITGKRLYFDPVGQTATFYPVKGGTYAMKIKDASYNWNVLKNEGNRVLVNSASAGGDCWVYKIYQTGVNKGKTIPGRYIK